MLIPVRCFTCNKVIGGHYEKFCERVAKGEDAATVMNDLGIARYCCRRIYMTHTDLIDEMLPYD
jgi:DNA-directed RNA polymerase subunit N